MVKHYFVRKIDMGISLNLLPKIPIIILYWLEDDEFPPVIKMLFDSTADRFLDVESLIFLVEGLVKNIESNLISV